MSEHGIEDFGTAKRKAAERLNVADAGALPSNTEVEASLAEYQRLFAAGAHALSLSAQRRAALRAMQSLAQFAPRLVGPVLNGTATAHSTVQLHVFADNPDAVALLLMDRGVAHEAGERRLRLDLERSALLPTVQFLVEAQRIEATVFPIDGIRQAPVSPVDGRPMRRADATELANLLEAAPTPAGIAPAR